jgi:uncharacterized cupin superfamily protein
MSKSIMIATASSVDLEPAPISPDWILAGTPEARNRVVAKSHDRTSYVMVWECTPGRFNWHYTQDEELVVISGEVFITTETGEERRLGPGDWALFPARSSATWRVTQRVRKVAVFRVPIPRPLAFCLRAWDKLLRVGGLLSASGHLTYAVVSQFAADAGRLLV